MALQQNSQKPFEESVNTSVKKMALGTMASRLMGLIRILLIGYALGIGRVGDAYNLANTTPNILHDLVLGGILSATFIPIFTKKLSQLSKEQAWLEISSVITLAGIILVGATILFEILAPEIINIYTIGTKTDFPPATKALAVELLRFFLPQIMFYGFVAISGALLNCIGKFSPITNSPIYGNIVAILMLLEVTLVSKTSTAVPIAANNKLIFLLGIGTTASIAVQFISIVPSLIKSNIPLRFNFNFKSSAIREIIHLSSWSFGFVIINQIALFVILALTASSAKGSVTAYTFAFTFFQLPYWLFAVSIATAVTPKISRYFIGQQQSRTTNLVSGAIKSTIAIMLPISGFFLVISTPLITALFFHGAASSSGVALTAKTLGMFSLGLVGYSIFMLSVRMLLAMHMAKKVFFLYLLENVINVILAFLFINTMGVKGIALSITVAYTTAAIVAIAYLNIKLGDIHILSLVKTFFKSLIIAAVIGVAAAIGSSAFPNTTFLNNVFDTFFGLIAAVVVLGGVGTLFSPKSTNIDRSSNKL